MHKNNLLKTPAIRSIILIRLMVGVVFISEGIQKFLFPADRGAGRFYKIGLSNSEFLGPFVGSFEILCGLLVLVGLFTRLAVIPLIIIMITAFGTTKIEILLQDGFWEMMHASRTDLSMFLASLFLLKLGGGKWSADYQLNRR